MSDLLDKLQRATEGSRELDALIWCHLNGKRFIEVFDQPHWRWQTQCFYRERPRSPQQVTRDGDVLDYTTNLQDAVSLVPEGWSLHLHRVPWNGLIEASLSDGDRLAIQGNASTLTLALCIAIIKAHEARAEAA